MECAGGKQSPQDHWGGSGLILQSKDLRCHCPHRIVSGEGRGCSLLIHLF